ncbi:MAG: hypothetical protein EOO27_35385, partial [Comamonadaceae bacterium]
METKCVTSIHHVAFAAEVFSDERFLESLPREYQDQLRELGEGFLKVAKVMADPDGWFAQLTLACASMPRTQQAMEGMAREIAVVAARVPQGSNGAARKEENGGLFDRLPLAIGTDPSVLPTTAAVEPPQPQPQPALSPSSEVHEVVRPFTTAKTGGVPLAPMLESVEAETKSMKQGIETHAQASAANVQADALTAAPENGIPHATATTLPTAEGAPAGPTTAILANPISQGFQAAPSTQPTTASPAVPAPSVPTVAKPGSRRFSAAVSQANPPSSAARASSREERLKAEYKDKPISQWPSDKEDFRLVFFAVYGWIPRNDGPADLRRLADVWKTNPVAAPTNYDERAPYIGAIRAHATSPAANNALPSDEPVDDGASVSLTGADGPPAAPLWVAARPGFQAPTINQSTGRPPTRASVQMPRSVSAPPAEMPPLRPATVAPVAASGSVTSTQVPSTDGPPLPNIGPPPMRTDLPKRVAPKPLPKSPLRKRDPLRTVAPA